MELAIDFNMKKRKPLFIKLFYSYVPLIVTAILFLILLVYFSTNNFYDSIIKKELQNRADNVLSLIITNDFSKNSIQNIAIKSSNDKSVRVTIIDEDGVVKGDSHKNPISMDNHKNRKRNS